MTFFTPAQLRVLKTGWIPALIAWMLTLLQNSPAIKVTGDANLAIKLVILTGLFTWEFVIGKKWRNVLILAVVATLAFGGQHFMAAHLPGKNTDIGALLTYVNLFTAYLLAIIIRFHLLGTENKIATGLLVTVIFYLLPKTGNPFSSGFLYTGAIQTANELYVSITSLLVFYCKMTGYYVILFLVENGSKWRSLLGKLPSKVQVFSKWEYLFMLMTTYFAYMGCIGDLSTRVAVLFEGGNMPGEPTWMGLLFMLSTVFFLYTGAILLRNIITGRALTIGKYTPWLLLLHLLPVFNIIAIAICFFARKKQETHMKNAVDYLHTKRQYAKIVMIAAGIIITTYNIYHLMVVPTGLRLTAIGVLVGLYLLKILAYIKLPAGKTFVYLVIGLNVITVAYGINEYLVICLAFIYLYYYLLMEIFYPQLEIEDTMQIAGRDAQGENEWEHSLG